MTDVVVDTLRLRGTHGRRLARVAARALPRALDRALADLGDVEISSVRVHLDLDPEDYDDESLAVLWADLVRAELLAHGGATSVGSASSVRADREPAPTPSGAHQDRVVAAARGWLSTSAHARGAVPAPLLRLADPAVAAAVVAAVGPAGWEQLVASLRAVLPVPASPSVPAGEVDRIPGPGDPRRDVAPDVAVTALPPAPAPAPDRPGVGRAAVPQDRGSAAAAGAADLLAMVGALNELRGGLPTPLDPGTLTRTAGLVLLYPWLTDHCRAAEALHPGLDRYDVREAALAALVADAAAVDDPLVRLLAGRVLPVETSQGRFELPHQDEVDASAGRVLASFASLLPGFERSTPEFVRAAWVVRLGALDLERSPALLTAATHPLDVLLPLLPYPLGLFRLPWSPPLSVRFRP